MKIGKRLKESYKSFENSKLFSIEEAVKLVKSNSKAKFDETIDISMNLGVDPRQSDQMVRGMVALPSGTGKDVKVAVFAKNEKLKEATEAGAEFVGEADLAEKIETGKIDFDITIEIFTSLDHLKQISKIAKKLAFQKSRRERISLKGKRIDVRTSLRSNICLNNQTLSFSFLIISSIENFIFPETWHLIPLSL